VEARFLRSAASAAAISVSAALALGCWIISAPLLPQRKHRALRRNMSPDVSRLHLIIGGASASGDLWPQSMRQQHNHNHVALRFIPARMAPGGQPR
jgi:hypothetical protein